MNLDEIEMSDVDNLSDSEVVYWVSVLQEQERLKQMRQALKNYLDVRDTVETPHTIRINSKVIG